MVYFAPYSSLPSSEDLDVTNVPVQLFPRNAVPITNIIARWSCWNDFTALVPAPRTHLVRYSGILAPAAKWRAQIVPTEADAQLSRYPTPLALRLPSSSRNRSPRQEPSIRPGPSTKTTASASAT